MNPKSDRKIVEDFVERIMSKIDLEFEAHSDNYFGSFRAGVATRRAIALWVLQKRVEERFTREWPWPELGRPGEAPKAGASERAEPRKRPPA